MSTAPVFEYSELLDDDANASWNVGRKREDLQMKFGGCASLGPGQVQTVMIRNLPRKIREEALLRELEGFLTPGSYDFFYLPWNNRRSSNDGYAFVNFLDPSRAHALIKGLDGKPWQLVEHTKTIKIVPAHIQGLALNLVHYMNSQVVGGEHAHAPIVLRNGQPMNFVEAVKMFCPPELVRQHNKDKSGAQSTLAMELEPDIPRWSSLGTATTSPLFCQLRRAGLPAGMSAQHSSAEDCHDFAKEWSSAGGKSHVLLAEMSTRSSLSEVAQHGQPDCEGHGWKTCDLSACSELSFLEADTGRYGTQRRELVELLASDAYGAAWKKLNEQLQATLMMYDGQLDPRDMQ